MDRRAVSLFDGERRPLLFAHRGCSADAPENTAAAFRLCLDHGVPGVELDVHECADGEIVVIHDSTLTRVAGLDAAVDETDYRTIASLDVGSWFDPRFSGERVMTLSQVFDLLGREVYYDIEIKRSSGRPGSLESKVTALIERRGLIDRCMVSSFNPYSVRAVRRMLPGLPTALIFAHRTTIPYLLRHGEGRIIARSPVLKPEWKQLDRRARSLRGVFKRKIIVTWTVDDAETARSLVELGVDGLVSNDWRVLTELHGS